LWLFAEVGIPVRGVRCPTEAVPQFERAPLRGLTPLSRPWTETN